MPSSQRTHLRERSLARALALVALAVLALAPAATAQAPVCIGAATLDPTSGCVDRLTTVVPSVTGPRREDPALGELGQERGWRGTRFTGHGCVMSEAVYEMGSVAGPPCVSAYRETMSWLRQHPEIDFVIATAEVDEGLPGPAATVESRKLRGFQKTFERFPRNVRRVVVLRDTPNATGATFDCLDRVVRAALAPAGPQCATPRRQALPLADAAMNADLFLYEARYRAVDMTDLMCSPSFCYPVLGGVLVNFGVGGHMTLAFARSMERQLLLRLEPLLPAPRA